MKKKLAAKVPTSVEVEKAAAILTDAAPRQSDELPQKPPSKLKAFCARTKSRLFARKKPALVVAGAVVAVLLILGAVPATRYAIAGLIIKKDVAVYATDATSHIDITYAFVTLDGKRSYAPGKSPYPVFFLNVPVGKHTIVFDAPNYTKITTNVVVGIGKAKRKNINLSSQATGRIINVRVSNFLTGKAVEGLTVKYAQSSGTTTKFGDVGLVIDPRLANIDIEVSGKGFNTTKYPVAVDLINQTNKQVQITPAGNVYFLSKASGKLDVVKTNLDGSGRQTVLTGTGKEDDNNTALLHSSDWKYLALIATRESNKQKVYLLTTDDNKLTTIDEGDANFDPIGWSGNRFAYFVYRNNYQRWQPKAASIKSFDGTNGKISLIDNSDASGSNDYNTQFSTFNLSAIFEGSILYTKTWYSGIGYLGAFGRQDQLIVSNMDGSTKKIVSSLDSMSAYFGSLYTYNPHAVIIQQSPSYGNDKVIYFELKADLTYKESASFSDEDARKSTTTYLASPNGKQTLWYEARDGKNAILVGDSDAQNSNEVAALADYLPYGWFDDEYILLSKNNSELYILPADSKDATPIKISDYHKVTNYEGY